LRWATTCTHDKNSQSKSVSIISCLVEHYRIFIPTLAARAMIAISRVTMPIGMGGGVDGITQELQMIGDTTELDLSDNKQTIK